MFCVFATLYKSTLRYYKNAKQNSTSRVRHVATKLSEAVGNFRNSIVHAKIVSCMDVSVICHVDVP